MKPISLLYPIFLCADGTISAPKPIDSLEPPVDTHAAKKAVIVGWGPLAAGHTAPALVDAGYQVVAASRNADKMKQFDNKEYNLFEKKLNGKTDQRSVHISRALAVDEPDLLSEIASADVLALTLQAKQVTTATPLIVQGFSQRLKTGKGAAKLEILICANGKGLAHALKESVLGQVNRMDNSEELRNEIRSKLQFREAVVDRIVPGFGPDKGDRTTVNTESHLEFTIEGDSFDDALAETKGVKFSGPRIDRNHDRKLYSVNGPHSVIAYLGVAKGKKTIGEALRDPNILETTRREQDQVDSLFVRKWGYDAIDQASYSGSVIPRFESLGEDDVLRIGREPIRKLARDDRLIAPALELAKSELDYDAVLMGIKAAFGFAKATRSIETAVSGELAKMLDEESPSYIAKKVCKVTERDALWAKLIGVIAEVKKEEVPAFTTVGS